MLPDYPSLKADIAGLLKEYFRHRVFQLMPGSDEIPRHTIFEGRQDAISRQGDAAEPTPLHAIETRFALTEQDLLTGSAQALFEQIHKAAEDMAQKQTVLLLQTVEESCNAIGNVINNAGKPFTPETLLSMINMVEIPFLPDGTPQLPTFFMPPGEEIRRIQELVSTDPHWRRQVEEIIEEKRRLWRDREAARQLAG